MPRRVVSRIDSKGNYIPAEKDAGDDKRLDDILFWQVAPGHSGTDKTFFQGKCNGHNVGDVVKKRDYEIARKYGVDTSGKLYVSAVADQRGPADPRAWVSGMDDLKRVVKKRGITCEGIVTNKGPEVEPNKPVALADDIVERVIKREVKANPNLAKKKKQELREMVIEKHGRKVK